MLGSWETGAVGTGSGLRVGATSPLPPDSGLRSAPALLPTSLAVPLQFLLLMTSRASDFMEGPVGLFWTFLVSVYITLQAMSSSHGAFRLSVC